MRNSSPWIAQLKPDRAIETLTQNIQTDALIVGGGIAGIATAYMTLTLTKRSVTLIEAKKVAHGATGHNAGQLVGGFEESIAGLMKTFGKKQTIDGLRAVEVEAWVLLESVIRDAQLTVPYSTFIGYGGYLDLETLLEELENVLIHKENDLPYHECFIAREGNIMQHIPVKYHGLCVEIPQTDIARMLGTDRPDYIAAIAWPSKMGCMNSALFTEQLAEYCLQTFPDRFQLYENTPVEKIVLGVDSAVLHAKGFQITGREVVLCTNGFENFSIENTTGTEINAEFHHRIEGIVGYMTSFYDADPIPFARWYFVPRDELSEAMRDVIPYYYITRRPFEAPLPFKGMVCIGGPEIRLRERIRYDPDSTIDAVIQENLLTFADRNVTGAKQFKTGTFWHGLMGYTKSGVRLVGMEPCNQVLMYNLGCNGIGILPAIYGARKIARHLNGEVMEPTMFDPQDVRCVVSDTL